MERGTQSGSAGSASEQLGDLRYAGERLRMVFRLVRTLSQRRPHAGPQRAGTSERAKKKIRIKQPMNVSSTEPIISSYNMGERQSWRVVADCKSVFARISRFESYFSHQQDWQGYDYLIVIILKLFSIMQRSTSCGVMQSN